jgi:hypothetical protein
MKPAEIIEVPENMEEEKLNGKLDDSFGDELLECINDI